MKQLFYRNILGRNPKKREVSMEEISDRTENLVSKKWICKYFIKERYYSENEDDLKNWIHRQKQISARRNCHILRHLDTERGINKIVCKVLGDFFVICRNVVYKIVYVNEVRIQIVENRLRMQGEKYGT